MLPEKLHIEQISRFHSTFKKLNEKIKAETNKEKRGNLSMQYYELTKLWEKIDDLIEFTVKHELDCMRLPS